MGCAASVSSIFPSPEYIPGPIIGFGAFGKIREIYRVSDDQTFVLKEFEIPFLKPRDAEVIKNELSIFKRLSPHPFIIDLYKSSSDNYSVSFLMEHLSGGDLRLALNTGRCFSEYQVAYIISTIGTALFYLHQRYIVHRDVKPENIVFNGYGVPKLVDFGVSCAISSQYGAELCKTTGGTKQYLAPEVFVREAYYHGYESDFWSLGVVMYELLFLQRPYELRVPMAMIDFAQKVYQESWKSLISAAKDIHPLSTARIPTINSCANNANDTSNEMSSPSFKSENPWYPKQTDTITLDSDELVVFVPNLLSTKEMLSSSGRKLLLSLLDVRIHLRYGVGENYPPFISHTWFTQFDLKKDQLASMPSPIMVDTTSVSVELTAKYTDFNFFDQVSTHPNPTSPAEMDSIRQILGTMSYYSPYYPKLFPPSEE